MNDQKSALAAVVLRTPQAAEYLGLGIATLEKMRMRGAPTSPPFIRLGSRAVGYLRADLDRWLEQNRRGSTSEAA